MASSKDRLRQGSAAMNKILSGATEPQEGPEAVTKTTAKRTTKKVEKADTGQSVKPEKGKQKVFSFWADIDSQKAWRTYAKAKGMTVSDLGRNAIDEYMKRHKLTDDEQKIYDLFIGAK